MRETIPRALVCADLNSKSLTASHLWVMTKRTKTKVHWSARSINDYMPGDGIVRSNRKTRGKLSCHLYRASLIILRSRVTLLFHATRLRAAISFASCVSRPFLSTGEFSYTLLRFLFHYVSHRLGCKLKTSLTSRTPTGATRSKFLDCSRRRQRVRTARFVRIRSFDIPARISNGDRAKTVKHRRILG